jgi:hypothetical protein
MITPELDDDYLAAHRPELLRALETAHPIAVLRALALAVQQAERGDELAFWLHQTLIESPRGGGGYEFRN